MKNSIQELVRRTRGRGTGLRERIFALDGNDTIDAGAGNDYIDGGQGNDLLNAGSGDDYLIGGAGEDTMLGGRGDDVYIVDSSNDLVVENINEGTDSVLASASYVLSDNIENLTLTGMANVEGTGNALDNLIQGNNGNNVLTSGEGNDTLYGLDGNDVLEGGAGVRVLHFKYEAANDRQYEVERRVA